jgi:hypothetical protein
MDSRINLDHSYSLRVNILDAVETVEIFDVEEILPDDINVFIRHQGNRRRT